MEVRTTHPKPRAAGTDPADAQLDAMTARSTTEVLGILRAAAPERDGRGHPIGMWKTGWQAQPVPALPEGAA